MTEPGDIRIAIVDYGLGNLYSVKKACEHVGAVGVITSDSHEIMAADGIILPGVGAFGDAMRTLRSLGLVETLRKAAAVDKPLMGICLGIQLLMSESHEFGRHEGLNIIEGDVVPFEDPREGDRNLKVPEICWNGIERGVAGEGGWEHTPLAGLHDGVCMYFIHSYYVRPSDEGMVLSQTRYGDTLFCSSVKYGSVHGFQFHPERSGPEGLRIYRSWTGMIRAGKGV